MTRPSVKTGRKRQALAAIDAILKSENDSLVRATRLQMMVEDATRDYWVIEMAKSNITVNIQCLQGLRDRIEQQKMKPIKQL